MLTAVPVVNKQKSQDICNAFVAGAPVNAHGDVFYGVNESNVRTWDHVRKSGRDWYFIDNSYFDQTRGVQFRVTKNAVQHNGRGETDGKRFAALGIDIAPWREIGDHIVVCPQSESFMRCIPKWPGNWAVDMARLLRMRTDRRVTVRGWTRDKLRIQSTLAADLVGAHALVTYSSAAAVAAILAGVPAWAACGPAAFIENQKSPENPSTFPDRLRWAGVLADNQWNLDEIRNGTAWQMINK